MIVLIIATFDLWVGRDRKRREGGGGGGDRKRGYVNNLLVTVMITSSNEYRPWHINSTMFFSD